MTTRVKQLEDLIEVYDQVLKKHTHTPETKAHFEQKRAAVETELEGERGAAGLNPTTGAKK